MFALSAWVAVVMMISQTRRDLDREARDALADGRYEQALGIYRGLVGSEPETASAHLGRGHALLALERHQMAVDAFETAVALAPNLVVAQYQLGRSLEALGSFERAIASYQMALELEPYHRAARYRMGRLLLRAGRDAEAEHLLTGYEPFRRWSHQVELLESILRAGDLAPADRMDKTLGLARLLMDGGDLERAGRVLTSAADTDPIEPRITVARARWLLLAGRPLEARVMLDEATAAGYIDVDALWLSAQLNLRARRAQEALADYERLLARWPDAPARVYHETGTAYAVNGRFREAITHFERAIAAEPSLVRAHADLGLAFLRLEDFESAERHLRAALDIRPELVPAQQGLASLLLDRGETEAAIAWFRTSVVQQPENPALHKNLALALHHAGRLEEAESELQVARDLESRH